MTTFLIILHHVTIVLGFVISGTVLWHNDIFKGYTFLTHGGDIDQTDPEI